MPFAERPNKKPRIAADECAPAILPAVSKNVSRIANKIHLSPELIARVATYAEAANSPELWNICLAVGPATSRIIRHYYLKQNHHFLTRCIRFFCSQKITNIKLRDYYLVWMTVNNDWKAYICEQNLHGVYQIFMRKTRRQSCQQDSSVRRLQQSRSCDTDWFNGATAVPRRKEGN